MSRSPLFSTYRTGENRVTASMLAVFERIDPGLLEKVLAGLAGESSFQLMSFTNQVAEQHRTVPDAVISANFRYLFEVKTERNATNTDQLQGHLEYLDGTHAAELLFVITPDTSEPQPITQLAQDSIVWASFRTLSRTIDAVLADQAELVSQQDVFLLRELQALFDEESLLYQDDVLVVAGRNAYPEYLEYGLYVCQPGRTFRRGAHYLAFYTDGEVKPEVPAILARFDHVVLSQVSTDLLEAAATDDSALARESLEWIVGQLQRMLQGTIREPGEAFQVLALTLPDAGQTLNLPQAIPNTLPHPFTYGQARYLDSRRLTGRPSGTDELVRR